MKIMITGGAGFIGSAVIRFLMNETDVEVVNVDKLTYAANLDSLSEVEADLRYTLEIADTCDGPALMRIFQEHRPDAVMHLAAESHVDRSIDGSADFIQTNIVGTYRLLEASLDYWRNLSSEKQATFRFHHVSTDEVYGSLGATGYFSEGTRYQPNNPYAASKASSDHLVRAWHHTYKLPVVTSNCSNNYGPYQFPEKLIPLMILKGLQWEPLPVYGTAQNVRDWLHVEDHARALWRIITQGQIGETYIVGGGSEAKNIEVVQTICDILDELVPCEDRGRRRMLITFVEDRPGHDFRYAMNATKIREELGWNPSETFETGLRKTVAWYIENRAWWRSVQDTVYDGARLGLASPSVTNP